MSTLCRTQIYLKDSQMKMLKIEAKRKKSPVAELIRVAIDKYLAEKEKPSNVSKDPLMRAVGSISLDVNDASLKHDEYLY